MGKNSHYGVIIDAGSSGTRIYVYKWLNPSVAITRASAEDLHSLPKLKLKSSKNIHPGVSVFADRPTSVGPEHLESLVSLALDEVPRSKIPDTPIFLLATAGVRFLPDKAQSTLLQEICHYFQTHTPFYLPDCKSHIQVISGETEGLYGWIAANYLLGGFDDAIKHDRGRDHHTYGFLDMGGASAQVAFAPNKTETEKHANDLKLVRMRRLDGTPLEYRVFTASWLGFGANKARSRYVESLVESYGSSAKEVPDPCLPKGLRTTLTGEPLTNERASHDQVLVGTGAFKECLLKTFPLLQKDAPCKNRPCLLNGQHAPAIDFDVNHFVGVSEYWHTTHGAFGKDYNEYDFAKYQDAVSEHCSRDWAGIEADLDKHGDKAAKKAQTAREACFKACWIINMLHDGIGIPRDNLDGAIGANTTKNSVGKAIDPFQPIHKVGGVQVTWTLGKMVLYAAGQVSPDPSSSLPVGFGSNVKAGALPDDFERAGSVPLTLPVSDDGHGAKDIVVLLVVILLFLLAGYLLRKPEWRRRLCGTLPRRRQFGHGRKLPRGSSSFISKLFGRAPVSYERIHDQGDESQLELGHIDADDYECSDTSYSPRLGNHQGPTTPRLNIDRFDDLRPPSEMDRNGLVIRTESCERLAPLQMLNAGRRSRVGSPTRLKSPLMTPRAD
ncbi:nucleoside diphosphatase [Ophiocordyceps camponoti-floridani]|uniref:Nucleoside diphosphatase n=1 Tax=Ophiocordyceps camponoti-floridani TaxID=2030778 RepID=A0A8H4Q410_9HYPO|nr:nucleoside diphosphatase [Ophiocordyceps camponoti-floridani]